MEKNLKIYIYIYTHIFSYIYITESLCCTPETNRTLSIDYISIKKNFKKKCSQNSQPVLFYFYSWFHSITPSDWSHLNSRFPYSVHGRLNGHLWGSTQHWSPLPSCLQYSGFHLCPLQTLYLGRLASPPACSEPWHRGLSRTCDHETVFSMVIFLRLCTWSNLVQSGFHLECWGRRCTFSPASLHLEVRQLPTYWDVLVNGTNILGGRAKDVWANCTLDNDIVKLLDQTG